MNRAIPPLYFLWHVTRRPLSPCGYETETEQHVCRLKWPFVVFFNIITITIYLSPESMDKMFSIHIPIKHIKIYLFINIKQLDALNIIISLFQASTCFEHMCSSSRGQNCIIQSLVSSQL